MGRSLAICLALASGAGNVLPAQEPVPIAEATVDADGDGNIDRIGETFRVRGTLTVRPFKAFRGDRREYRFYLQDDTGGLRVVKPKSTSSTDLRTGLAVEIEGVLDQYNGMPVLMMSELIDIGPSPPVEPVLISQGDYDGEKLCGSLVTMHSPIYYEEKRYFLGEGPDRVRAFLMPTKEYIPFVADIEPGFYVSVTGVLEQYDTTPPFLGGYRIRPRNSADVKVGVPFLSRPEGRATVVIGLVLLAAMLGWLALRWWRAKSQLESPKVQRIHALGTMAGGIAHEFNNYLLAISGFTELARDELADDSPARPHLDEVLAASSRAKTLIEQILSYSTTKDSELVPIDARGAVKEGLRLLSAVMPATVQIVEVLDSDTGMLRADRGQLSQVILNLGTNASHAMPQGGEFRVALGRVQVNADQRRALGLASEGPHAQLEISDTGVGMEEDVRQRIFDPFFSTRERSKGTGLGLSVVQGIVKRHGGVIQVESEVGKGTTFRILLPIASAVEVAEHNQSSDSGSSADAPSSAPFGGRALVVDDQRNLTALVEKMLVKMGFEVVCATDGALAYGELVGDASAFDLIISDLTMPRVDGIELARRARELGVEAPFLLMTGNASALEEDDWLAAGVTSVLTKPFMPEELQAAVAKLMATAGA